MYKRIMAFLAITILTVAVALPLSIGRAQVGAISPMVSTTLRIRLVNAANTATGVDLHENGTLSTVILNVLSLKVSKYDTLAAGGSYTITLTQAGTTTAVGTPLTYTFVSKTNYTLVLLPDMTWLVIVDVNPTPTVVGDANARLINLSPNNNPVSVAVNGTVPSQFNSIAYKFNAYTATNYMNIAPSITPYSLTIPGSTAKAVSFSPVAGYTYSVMVLWDSIKGMPVILRETDQTTGPATTATPISGPTATPMPTVGANAPDHLFLPMVHK